MANKKTKAQKGSDKKGSKKEKGAKKKRNDPRILVVVNKTKNELNLEIKEGALSVAKGGKRKLNTRTSYVAITPMIEEGERKGLPNKELKRKVTLKREGHITFTVTMSGGKLRFKGEQYWPTDRDQFMGKAKKDGVKVK